MLKYDRVDARDILERASARETTARVAAGALAKRLLDEFGVEIGSHVVSLGGIRAAPPAALPVPLNEAADRSEVRVLDPAVEAEIIRRIDAAKKAGDTLGGEVEVVARGVVVGLGQPRELGPEARRPAGRHADVDSRGQGGRDRARRRGGAPAGLPGARSDRPVARRPGRVRASSALAGDRRAGFRRPTNNAGGLEGGITTGEPLVLRVAMKPISTLMSPLPTVDLATGQPANAQSERSDVTAVPAMGVIAEALTAIVLADAMLEKFGGDSLARDAAELRRVRGVARARAGRRSGKRSRAEMRRHILLVGLPGVGKSTVGKLVAEALPAPLLDIDGILSGRWGCRWRRSSAWWASPGSAPWSATPSPPPRRGSRR